MLTRLSLRRCLMFSFAGVCLLAQGQVGLIPRPPRAPDYVLGAGDQITVHVLDLDEISEKPIRIDPSGSIDLPMAGRVEAGGLTIEQFKALLAAKLSKYINTPRITVSLVDDQSRPVSIVGAVTAPGVHQLEGPKRLIEVISLAGGTRADAGSRVIVTREGKWGPLPLSYAKTDPTTGFSTASLSLDDLMASKNPSDNFFVDPNDIISIPKAEIVYVVGDVRKPGGFQLTTHETITLLQALSLAQGLDRDAKSSKAKILRPSPGGDGRPLEIPVNISAIFAGKAPDIPLYGNDILFVPNSSLKASGRAAAGIITVATGAAVYRF